MRTTTHMLILLILMTTTTHTYYTSMTITARMLLYYGYNLCSKSHDATLSMQDAVGRLQCSTTRRLLHVAHKLLEDACEVRSTFEPLYRALHWSCFTLE